MHVGIELAFGLDLGQPLLREQVGQRAMNKPDAVLDLPLFVLRRSLERTAEVIEDRDQLLDEPLVRTLGERRLLARVPLAEVVELGREPLQPVEELVAVSLESVDVDAGVRGACRGNLPVPPSPLHWSASADRRTRLRLVVHYAFGASCSSSMTS